MNLETSLTQSIYILWLKINFPVSLPTCKISDWLTSSFFKWCCSLNPFFSCFKNSTIWLTKGTFDPTQEHIFTSPFTFLQSILACGKSLWLTKLFLWYGFLMNPVIWLAVSIFTHAKLKIYKPSLTFLESISAFQKSSWFMNYYLKVSRFKNAVIWVAKNISKNLHILMFLESLTTCHISNWFINFFLRISWLRILQSDWLRAFLTPSKLKFLNHLLRLLNHYLHVKNQVDLSISSWDRAM